MRYVTRHTYHMRSNFTIYVYIQTMFMVPYGSIYHYVLHQFDKIILPCFETSKR